MMRADIDPGRWPGEPSLPGNGIGDHDGPWTIPRIRRIAQPYRHGLLAFLALTVVSSVSGSPFGAADMLVGGRPHEYARSTDGGVPVVEDPFPLRIPPTVATTAAS